MMEQKQNEYSKSNENQNFIDFPFASLKQTLTLLDCSKFYLYKLIRKSVLHPYYLEKNETGEPTGKPYFKKEEIANVFFKVAN